MYQEKKSIVTSYLYKLSLIQLEFNQAWLKFWKMMNMRWNFNQVRQAVQFMYLNQLPRKRSEIFLINSESHVRGAEKQAPTQVVNIIVDALHLVFTLQLFRQTMNEIKHVG